MSGYPENSFMIVSADNLDYVHKYARSFNGKLETSWHGKIVQPKPNLLTDSLTTPSTPSATIAEPLVTMGKRLYSTRSPLKNLPSSFVQELYQATTQAWATSQRSECCETFHHFS